MTAINVSLQPDAAHLITDGAAIDGAGIYVGEVPKVTILPHASTAFAVNGTIAFRNLVVGALSFEVASFDALRKCIKSRLKEMITPNLSMFEQKFGEHVFDGSVVVTGWSNENDAPAAFLINTHSFTADQPAWEVMDIPGFYILPHSQTIERKFGELNNFDEEMAIALLEEQRATIGPTIRDWKTPIVGGFVQITTVGRNSIETRVVKRWPDKIGEAIKPEIAA